MNNHRDLNDLQNQDIAVFQFRDYTVLKYNKRYKRLMFGDNANECMFIPEDYDLMTEFLQNCKKFTLGEIDNLENIRVF